jgi:hypothetical protein
MGLTVDGRPSASCCATRGSCSPQSSEPTCSPAASTRACFATLAAIGERHTVVITALRADYHPGTNHEGGRAMDIGAVDGQRCDGRRTGACAQLVRELAAVGGEMRATELIYCWDSDGPADPRGFARADHCDHVHWGLDG